MVMVTVMEEGYKLPVAVTMVIAPSTAAAREHAKKELKMYFHKNSLLEEKIIEQILFEDVPTTIFLYTQLAGRIK